MGYLMTATLLSSFKWMEDAPSSWKERATTDFYAKVKREDKFEPTPEITRGMNFERLICDKCNTLDEASFLETIKDTYVPLIKPLNLSVEEKEEQLSRILTACKLFYSKCSGGQQQVKVTKDIEVDNLTFTLFGYADVLFPEQRILDIKTCTRFKESKYSRSVQHLIYQYCTGIKDFQYIVANYDNTEFPQECIVVDTSIEDLQTAENIVKGRIHNLVMYLKTNNLWDSYTQLFCRGKH